MWIHAFYNLIHLRVLPKVAQSQVAAAAPAARVRSRRDCSAALRDEGWPGDGRTCPSVALDRAERM